MKQTIIHILSILLLIMAFPFHSSGSEKEIDFNFPQDVSKNALADLDKALKGRDDGQLLVDALVRYSIAQGSITKDNMDDIISRIETAINKEKRPHIRALLYHLEAMIYEGYRDRYARWSDRNNPVEETPADVSEWDRKQFDKKIAELVEKSLADPDPLKTVAVTSLPDIIKCNKLGATYIPTLHEFLLMKGRDMLMSVNIDNDEPQERIKADWRATTEGNVPAHIYALTQTQQTIPLETYNQYQDNEHCAIMLNYITWENNKTQYKALQDYVARFPNSVYYTEVKNRITQLESKHVNLYYPSVRSTRDKINVTANVQNANSFTIEVYRVPDELLKEYRLRKSDLQFVSRHPVTVQGNVPFNADNVVTTLPPLPYGVYVILPQIERGGEKSAEPDIIRNSMLRVTDIALFNVSRNDNKDLVAAVDVNTGKPQSLVTIKDEKDFAWGVTGDGGILAVPEFKDKKYARSSHQLTGTRSDDRYGYGIGYSKITLGNDNSHNTATIYTDLGVYRPGETIHWTAIVYAANRNGRSVIGGKKVEAIFMDNNNKSIDTATLTTDEFGRIEGSFVVPKDRMNGRFYIQLKEKTGRNDYLAGHSVSVSEYKTPTFEVTFPDPRRSYVAGQPVKVTGKAMTYSGLPVQNTEVRLSLIQNQWSWWWWRISNNGGEHLQDTTVMTDEQGNFMIEFPAEMFKENIGYKPGRRCWARYNYQVMATITTDAGETHEESTSFIVGMRRGIELGSVNNDIYLNDKPIKLPLKYNTTDEEHPDTYCTWEVTPIDGQTPIKTGNLNTADPTIDLTKLPSGQYKLKITSSMPRKANRTWTWSASSPSIARATRPRPSRTARCGSRRWSRLWTRKTWATSPWAYPPPRPIYIMWLAPAMRSSARDGSPMTKGCTTLPSNCPRRPVRT